MWYKFKFLLIGLVAVALIGCSDDSGKEEEEKNIPEGKWSMLQFGFPDTLRSMFVTFDSKTEETYVGLGRCACIGDASDPATWHIGECRDLWRYSQYLGWKRMSDFPGQARFGAVAFVIGNYAYVGLGMQEMSPVHAREYFKDFWRYDMGKDEWEEVQYAFPGNPRVHAVAFSINGKGYVGMGKKEDWNIVKDFYEFDPETGWKEILFPGDSRYGATAFAVDEKGYIGLGNSGSKPIVDFYRFDPTDGSWTAITTTSEYQPMARYFAAASVLYKGDEPYVYIMGGLDSDGQKLTACWGYDPRNNKWMQVTPLPDGLGACAALTPLKNEMVLLNNEGEMNGHIFSIGE